MVAMVSNGLKSFCQGLKWRVINLGLVMVELFNWLRTFSASAPVDPAHGRHQPFSGIPEIWWLHFICFSRQQTACRPVLHAYLILHTSSGFKNLRREADMLSADAAMHLNGFRARMRMRCRESHSHPRGCRGEINLSAFCQIQHVGFCQPWCVQLIFQNREQTGVKCSSL